MVYPRALCYSENDFKALCHPLAEDARKTLHLFFFILSVCCWVFSSMHTPPVIVLCQSHLLKVNVEPLAFGGL